MFQLTLFGRLGDLFVLFIGGFLIIYSRKDSSIMCVCMCGGVSKVEILLSFSVSCFRKLCTYLNSYISPPLFIGSLLISFVCAVLTRSPSSRVHSRSRFSCLLLYMFSSFFWQPRRSMTAVAFLVNCVTTVTVHTRTGVDPCLGCLG